MAFEGGVHGVVEERVVELAAGAGAEDGLAVDEDGAVTRGDLAVDVLEVGRAPHRVAVGVAGRDVMAIGRLVIACRLQEPGQAEVRLGEAGLAADQLAIAPEARLGSVASSRRAASTSRAKAPRVGRGVSGGRTERFGSNPASLPGGITRTGSAPTASQ